jgi:hypothetical protein
MKLHLAVHVDRDEGKTESGDNVAEALADSLDGFGFEVEDSEYSITSAEVAAPPKKGARSGVDQTALLLLVDRIMDLHTDEFPVMSGKTPTTDIDLAIQALLFVDGIGPAIVDAKVADAKAKARA